jgi:predicted TIM-barrel fold metal-dependent hydrolase
VKREKAMNDHGFTVFDSDGHVDEDHEELAACFEGAYAKPRWTKISSVFPSLDGWSRSVIIDRGDAAREHRRTDAVIWAGVLDTLGAEGSVLYPTSGLAMGLMQDAEHAAAAATAYNNWLEAHYTGKDSRLYGAGLMAVQDPEAARAELKRCAEQRTGFRAMILPAVTAQARHYGDQAYWPLYEEAERQNMALAVHGAPSRGMGLDHFDKFIKVHTLSHPMAIFIELTDMMFSGVFDAFPKLRVAYLEAGCGWVPFMRDRMDYEYRSIHGNEVKPRLSRKPSDYFAETGNIWVSTELDESAMKYAIDAIGSTRLLYASDYGHEASLAHIAEEQREFIADPAYDASAKANILARNGRELYGFI